MWVGRFTTLRGKDTYIQQYTLVELTVEQEDDDGLEECDSAGEH